MELAYGHIRLGSNNYDVIWAIASFCALQGIAYVHGMGTVPHDMNTNSGRSPGGKPLYVLSRGQAQSSLRICILIISFIDPQSIDPCYCREKNHHGPVWMRCSGEWLCKPGYHAASHFLGRPR